MATATLTRNGQVTIPAAIRARLGLKTGDRIDFVVGPEGKVTLIPRKIRLEDLRGILRRTGQRAISVREMDEGICRAVTMRWKRVARQSGK